MKTLEDVFRVYLGFCMDQLYLMITVNLIFVAVILGSAIASILL